MAFLVPALTALVSDVGVVWLGRRAPYPTAAWADDHWVYHPSWTVPVAICRLVLLCVPLLWHSYTGTAVSHVVGYQVFYGSTAFALAVHAVGLALMDPESLEAIVPWDVVVASTTTLHDRNPERGRHLLEHLHELRRIWWMLGLTGVSVLCHWIVLWHVRSTAPSTATLGPHQHKKAPTVYFAVRATSHSQEPALMNAMNGA